MNGWDLIGEDADALFHDGLLPLDWRTKARALHDYAHHVDRFEAVEAWQNRDELDLRHGSVCWAPPGEWYGGEYVVWADTPQDSPDGWVNVGEHSDHAEHGADVMCLRLDGYDDAKVRYWCSVAPPSIHLITCGEGWPWLSRILRPCTVLVLDV